MKNKKNKLKQRLSEIIKCRRLALGKDDTPLGWLKLGDLTTVAYTVLYRFCNKDGQLGIEAIRKLAAYAKDNNDNEMLAALGCYALNVDMVLGVAPGPASERNGKVAPAVEKVTAGGDCG